MDARLGACEADVFALKKKEATRKKKRGRRKEAAGKDARLGPVRPMFSLLLFGAVVNPKPKP